ncbi:hypothetical protein [Thauera sinica]|uniref:DUF4259 domain-containing protein n=1 Tax=Thauera sinica TaxID=2665146 RepID=A0ABW1ANQ0_9RHOO|nr:hypothetical protein [Thauera sp. K11]
MGAWGVNPFECDEGLDVKERWSSWTEGHGAISYDEAANRFFLQWGDSINHGDTVTNNEVIALAAIYIENGIDFPKKLLSATEDAINRELDPSEIEKWEASRQSARQDFLLELLKNIGGTRRKPKNPNLFLDPALHYRSVGSARDSLLKAYKKIKSSKIRIGLSKAGFPSFILTLDRLMNYRIWEKDSAVYIQASNERLLMLATYLAIGLNYSEKELEFLLDEIVKRTGK